MLPAQDARTTIEKNAHATANITLHFVLPVVSKHGFPDKGHFLLKLHKMLCTLHAAGPPYMKVARMC